MRSKVVTGFSLFSRAIPVPQRQAKARHYIQQQSPPAKVVQSFSSELKRMGNTTDELKFYDYFAVARSAPRSLPCASSGLASYVFQSCVSRCGGSYPMQLVRVHLVRIPLTHIQISLIIRTHIMPVLDHRLLLHHQQHLAIFIEPGR